MHVSRLPSQATKAVGTIPSESFTMLGEQRRSAHSALSQKEIYRSSHNFTQQEAGTHSVAGVTIDKAGNLYGTTK